MTFMSRVSNYKPDFAKIITERKLPSILTKVCLQLKQVFLSVGICENAFQELIGSLLSQKCYMQYFDAGMRERNTFEPVHEETYNLDSDQVRHKPG